MLSRLKDKDFSIPVSNKPFFFFTVTSCTVAVIEFMDFTWSYITDCLAESLTIFEDFVDQGQEQFDLSPTSEERTCVNWSSKILDDKEFP